MKPHRMYRGRALPALGIFFGVSLLGLAGMVGTASADCANAPSQAQCDTPGRPADGTVGNADDKTPPPGQTNNPDKNKGHECDGNKGIGAGNPAHEGCATTNTTVPGGNPGGAGSSSSDLTVTTTPPPEGEVLGETLEAPDAPAAEVVTAAPAAAAPAAAETELPRTGSEILRLALFALGLLFTGFGLVGLARPRETLAS